MMIAQPPLMYITVVADDHPFAAELAGKLQQRGLAVQLSIALPPNTPAMAYIQQCVACFVVITPASNAAPALQQEWQQALALGKPVIPLILRAKSDIPPALGQLQWIDFSESAETGWLDLLMTLDIHGLARFPHPAVPFLDWDLALARAYRGRMPYTWHSYRINANYYRNIGRAAIRTSLIFIPISLCGAGWLIQRFQSTLTATQANFRGPIIVLAIVAALGLFLRATLPLARQSRHNLALVTDRSEIVIVTPEGFGVRMRPATTVFQFRDIAAIIPLPNRRAETAMPPPRARSPQGALSETLTRFNSPQFMTNLRDQTHGLLEVRLRDGRATTVALGTRFPQPAIIIQQIITAFQRYTAQPAMQQGNSGSGQASRIFISYARKDQQEVDQLDMALQQNGLQTWMDRNMLTGGQQWSRELQQAIDACAALVVCVSPQSLASPVVRQEYAYALQCGKPVIAVRLQRGGRVPALLQQRMRADFSRGVTQSLRQGLCPLLLVLAEVGVPGEAQGGFNPMLVLARSLAGRAEPSWHIYRSRSLFMSGIFLVTLVLTILPVALVPVVAWITEGDLWYMIGTGLLGPLSALLMLTGLVRIARERPLVITTPAGFVLITSGALRGYNYADYAGMMVAARGDYHQEILNGTLLLKVRATGQPMPVSTFGTFPQQRQIAQQIAADGQRIWGHMA